MKKIIMKAKLVDGSDVQFDFFEIKLMIDLRVKESIIYIKYRGKNYSVKKESIDFNVIG
ncbi:MULTISPECIES: hypothetical protein [Thermoactinomyces]|uniref:Uncharacterized protein n=1 Tax=Thermoactinomyces daqus TaxID=1329516 RepID=A0A7W1XCD3_9BACL|nr:MULTISPECIES: hypothetical protein [Thermoactinomyces]MBA4543969.1 hypothetical protein [Thermoactinomyces daqus]MBH8607971.1 hypothetical protein [Thermoactinomyces sp. CICC 10521]